MDFEEKHIRPILNPNQRQFMEDERRYKEKLSMMENDGNSSPTDLYVRKKEENHDLEVLDRHDSFYYTTKSLLVLFQIMGIMPIRRNRVNPHLPSTLYSYRSWVFLWAFTIFSIESVVVAFVGKERILKFIHYSDKRFDEIIYNIIFISLLVPHVLLPVASWRHGPQVAIFKNMWTSYQYKYSQVTGTPIVFPNLYPLTWALCIFSWSVSFAVNLAQYYLQPDFTFWHTFAYYPIIAMLNCFCSLWYINCNAFGTASRALVEKLQQTLASPKPAEKLTEYRHLWVDLSHMMQQLGRAYSNMYAIYCLVIFFTTIIATYGAMSEIIDHGVTYKEFGLFILVFYCMSLLFIICNEAYHASKSVGLDFQTRLLNVNITVLDNATQNEIQMFLVAIAKNPPTMSLDGYADINRGLITSNITFMATYLVVLLQFKLTLLRQSIINSIRLNATMEFAHKM